MRLAYRGYITGYVENVATTHAAEEAFVILRIPCTKYHYATYVTRSRIHPRELLFTVDHDGDQRIRIPVHIQTTSDAYVCRTVVLRL